MGNLNSPEMYSQPQIVRPRRGASIVRASTKSKYAESMGKFRKDFIKDTSLNFYDVERVNNRPSVPKEDSTMPTTFMFDGEVNVEEMHYQMVKLHQDIRRMQCEN